MVEEACAKGVITQEEKAAMERAKTLRRKAIMVDDFPKDLGPTEIYQTHRAGYLRGAAPSAKLIAIGAP